MADQESSSGVVSDVFAGAGMGLLLGVLVGMSTSPVVGIVVGALASVLAVFLGLESGPVNLGSLRVNGARIGSLGIATIFGLSLGLWVRINNPFSGSPEVQLASWIAALPDDPTLAKQLMVFERTGLEPGRLVFDSANSETVEVKLSESSAGKQPVLFSALSKFNVCSRLNPDDHAQASGVLLAYTSPNAPEVLPLLAESISSLPADKQMQALTFSYQTLCFLQREGPQ